MRNAPLRPMMDTGGSNIGVETLGKRRMASMDGGTSLVATGVIASGIPDVIFHVPGATGSHTFFGVFNTAGSVALALLLPTKAKAVPAASRFPNCLLFIASLIFEVRSSFCHSSVVSFVSTIGAFTALTLSHRFLHSRSLHSTTNCEEQAGEDCHRQSPRASRDNGSPIAPWDARHRPCK